MWIEDDTTARMRVSESMLRRLPLQHIVLRGQNARWVHSTKNNKFSLLYFTLHIEILAP